jgi:hypothetical protein
MAAPAPDDRDPQRRARHEQIASEPPLPPPDLPPDATASRVEAHLPSRRPLAVAGVVENGVVRPLDPGVRLTERSRVIIVVSKG